MFVEPQTPQEVFVETNYSFESWPCIEMNHIGSKLPTYSSESKEGQEQHWLNDSNEWKKLQQLTNYIGSNWPTDANKSK